MRATAKSQQRESLPCLYILVLFLHFCIVVVVVIVVVAVIVNFTEINWVEGERERKEKSTDYVLLGAKKGLMQSSRHRPAIIIG
jgi:ABC-type Fe3+ transport system permease subunit